MDSVSNELELKVCPENSVSAEYSMLIVDSMLHLADCGRDSVAPTQDVMMCTRHHIHLFHFVHVHFVVVLIRCLYDQDLCAILCLYVTRAQQRTPNNMLDHP